ncbi:MAG: DUF2156 domain-containing protein [Clostridia bacterium]|nr:DUF2156 domain-containing protein [Clostridia bacterium]
MLEFKPITLNEIPLIKQYLKYTKSRACDNTVGGTFMWRDYFVSESAFLCGNLVFKTQNPDGSIAFSMPLGENLACSFERIKSYCKKRNIPIEFCLATKEDVEVYSKYFDIEIIPTPNWNDYVYDTNALATFAGRAYNGQRNHTNAFLRENPSWEYKTITSDNIADVRRFYYDADIFHAKDAELYVEEQKKVVEVLDNFEVYGMIGGAIYVEGKVIAFALGEIMGDTLHTHIEKADKSIRGSYQMIVREYNSANLKYGIKYTNRQDDAGDEGLRRSKLSYHPCEIIEKYTVKVKKD